MAGDIIQRFGVQIFGDTKDLDKSLKDVDKKLANFGKGLKGLGKLVGLSFGGYTIKKLADMGKQMSNLATQTGLSVTSLTAMSSAFKAIGSNAGTFSRIMGRMNQGIVGLALGNPEIASKLASMGISTVDNQGRLKSGKQTMMEAADWARQMKKSGFDSRLIIQALSDLGFDAASAQKAMYGGSGAFYAEEAKARKEGRYFTGDEAKKLRELSIALSTLGDSLTYLSGSVIAPLSSIITSFANGLKSSFGEVIENIRKKMETLKPVIDAFSQAAKFLGDIIGKAVNFLLNFGDIMENIFTWIIEKIDWLVEKGFGWLLGGVHEDVELKDSGFQRNADGKLEMTPEHLEQMNRTQNQLGFNNLEFNPEMIVTANIDKDGNITEFSVESDGAKKNAQIINNGGYNGI